MVIYNIIFIIMLINLKLKIKYIRKIILFFLILLSSFRGSNIGVDTENYIRIFQMVKLVEIKDMNMEYGYLLINRLISMFSQNEIYLFFILNCIIFILLNKFIKYFSLDYDLSLLIYYCFYYFNYNFNIVRQTISFSIICYALIYLSKEKLLKFYILLFIASTFHFSALTLVPLGVLYKKFLKKNFQIYFFIVAVILNLSIEKILEIVSRVIPYLNNKLIASYGIYNVEVSRMGMLLRIIIFCYCLYLLFIKYKKENIKKKVPIIVYIYGVYLLIILQNIGYVGVRIALLYKGVDIIIYTYIIKQKNRNTCIEKIILGFLLIYYLMSSYNGENILPYVLNDKILELLK